MTHTVVEGDQYNAMLALLDEGRLPAALAVTSGEDEGLWIDSFDASRVDFVNDEVILNAAIIALRTSYRTARFAGVHPKVNS